jgi:hypothetical protein
MVAVGVAGVSTLASAQQRQQQGRLYRWVDQNGVVHYSDSVPPEFAETDRDILNKQGVAVGSEEGLITAEERAEMERLEAEAAERRQRQQDAARRDNMLLETYLTVDDIEDLRDRRLELLESQIKVTELYLANLRKRLATLQVEASHYKPHSDRDDAAELPDELALDIARTLSSIQLYEQRLSRTRSDQSEVRASFDRDIVRFKELKGG